MTVSPTRKRLDRRRGRLLLALGITEIISALLWRNITDLDFAEGRKTTGILSAILTAAFLFVGVSHIRDSKD